MSTFKKVLIVGFGSIGRKHARIINKLCPLFEISICSKLRNNNFPEMEQVKNNFESIEESLVWSPDYVIISSPCNFHLEQALFFAERNIPIFIEKPIGQGSESSELWDKLLSISKKSLIMVGYVFRHDECFKEMRKIIKSKKFGKLVEVDSYCGSWLPNWRGESDYKQSVSSKKSLGGGVLLELSHDLDIVNTLFGPINIQYSSYFNSQLLDIDVEDAAIIHANSNKCNSITIKLNFCTNPQKRFLRLRFSNCEIIWNLLEREIVTKYDNNNNYKLFKSNFDNDFKYLMQLKNFFGLASKQEKAICSVDEGLNVLKLITLAKKLNTK